MQVTYKHIRDDKGKLIATRCAIVENPEEEETSPEGHGIAICSENDNFSRKIGRDISYRRAVKALHAKRDTLPIRIRNCNLHCICVEYGYRFKSTYCTISCRGEY